MEPHTIQATLAILLLGGVLGFIGGLFGIGGGIIAIPLLVYGFGMDQAHAQGTALVMMVPNLLLGWYRYNQHHSIPTSTAWKVAATACLSTWLFAHIAVRLDQVLMRAIFSLFLLGISIHALWRQAGKSMHPDIAPRDTALLPLVGILGGASMGLLGVGGGLVASPLLTGWFRLRQTIAQSYSLVLVAPSSVVALMTYSSENMSIGQQDCPWHLAACSQCQPE